MSIESIPQANYRYWFLWRLIGEQPLDEAELNEIWLLHGLVKDPDACLSLRLDTASRLHCGG